MDMTVIGIGLLVLVFAGLGMTVNAEPFDINKVEGVPMGQGDWELTFADEFEGEAGSKPDAKKWTYDLGGGGWGNNELQTYTDRAVNAHLDGEGHLIIKAMKDNFTGKDGIAREYTSARLKTQGLFGQKYGKFEVRAKLPTGKGIWSAAWMLGENISTVGWPACGEIDILENVGDPKTVHGTLHGPHFFAGKGLGAHYTQTESVNFADGFHVYGVEWEPLAVRFYVDGVLYKTRTPEDFKYFEWPFDVDSFVILNLAIGGNWPGSPNETTVFPQEYVIDYVRIYKDKSLVVNEKALAAYHEGRVKRQQKIAEEKRFKGAPVHAIPGIVQFMNFKDGGEGVAYHDLEAHNHGGEYRLSDGVDIQVCSDEGSDFNLGWNIEGEWLNYDIDVKKSGTYQLIVTAAAPERGGHVYLEVDGKRVTPDIHIPETGDWQNWTDLVVDDVKLKKGRHVLKFVLAKNRGPNGVVGNFARLEFREVEVAGMK
ncbi:family 16 glycosylhydrolase [Planctomycetota bacterium]|nr:family 16 glycosylhydrolase [Planctomycetota bacterium]